MDGHFRQTWTDIFGNNVDMELVVVVASLVGEILVPLKELLVVKKGGKRKATVLEMGKMPVMMSTLAHMLMKQVAVEKEYHQLEQVGQ